MIAPNIAHRIHESVAAQIRVRDAGTGLFAVDVPLAFPDGDQCEVLVSENDDGTWCVRDAGATVMRASYAADVDVLSAGYKDRFHKIAEFYRLKEHDGEMIREGADDVGDAVFAIAQASLDVVNLARTRSEKSPPKKSKFMEELTTIVVRATGARAVPDWCNTDIDPSRLWRVAFWLERRTRPLYVFPANTKGACMHSTMTCLYHRQHSGTFDAVAINDPEASIPPSELMRLEEVVKRPLFSIDEPEALESFLTEAAKE